jgi:glyoxalase family protein
MAPPLVGLHHVTATVDLAQPDLDFCVGLLGLRLVKQTVNFDNHRVFHFYYGDQRGTPGTIWTTFPYAGQGVRVGTIGAGQVVTTAFAVPRVALPAWRERIVAAGREVSEDDVFGEPRLLLRDPSGLEMALIGSDADTREPWTGGGIDASLAIRGLHSVSLLVSDLGPTEAFLADVLGLAVSQREPGRVRVAIGEGGVGRQFDIQHDPEAVPGRNGLGTVHHVALAISDEESQRTLHEDLQRRGVQVTPVMDRQYFRSIYFREPGGVLIEVATMAPGFTVDEPLSALGTSLKLPPWQEPQRDTIEAGLPPIGIRR